MSIHRPLIVATLLCGLISVVGCGAGKPISGGTAPSSRSDLDGTIAGAMDTARDKLRTENIEISDSGSNKPRAEISPQGDLLIGGKPIAVTPEQHELLLRYRGQLITIAEVGIDIGTQGAELGTHAASAALSAVFSGKSDRVVERQVETQASGIRHAAAKLCDQLPALRESQQKLAATLPSFRPYATMTQDDIDDCRREHAQR